MNVQESPDHIEYIRTEGDCKSWSNEETEELNSSLKICCIPLPRRLFLFAKYVAPTLILLFSFAADIFSGVAVAISHYRDNHIWWFSLTIVFICAPAVMFIAHAILVTITNPEVHFKKKLLWIVLYICTGAGCLLWPLWDYVKKLVYAIRAITDEENSTVHLEKFHSVGSGSFSGKMHEMLKAFLQSAPQLLLQMYILISSSPGEQDQYTIVTEVISIIFSLNSLTIVIVHFEVNSKHHPSRTATTPEQSQEVSDLCCVIVEYLWWMCSITARVLALAFFATVFKFWVFIICAIHAATISTCLIFNHPSYSLNNFVIAIFMGLVYIFCFVEYKVDFGMLGRVVGLYILYYAFTFSQNVCMVLSAYFLSSGVYSYHLPVVITHFVLFFLGIFFMLFYLGLLRPFYLYLLKKARPPVE
ncbi:XK-related protein 6-like [Argiope bruennichi]|uniref:XK-related protein 6-like n=1 Tax=Argiope bruennichi TaxID=94029 RepID=UPI0024949A5E|nr:XK-related protein 6-like [Argiope bruennichi]XP_055926121.1 XK-related protein 6-like [Argiope bruennichi]